MNTAVAPFNSFLEDVNLSKGNEILKSGANPVDLNELFHELRQPLSVIETLAHFIELTTTDEKILPRLDHIQRMLLKTHQLLEEAGARS